MTLKGFEDKMCVGSGQLVKAIFKLQRSIQQECNMGSKMLSDSPHFFQREGRENGRC